MTDAGQYYCEVTVHSSSHIIASDLGIRPLLNLTFQRVDHDTGKHLSLIVGCSLNLTFFQSQLSWFWFYKSTLNYASCLITFFLTTYSCNCFLQTIDIHLVEEFKGEVSASWAHTSIEATLRTGYNLTCVPLMAGIPVPPPLQLPSKDTSANMSGLFSGVTFNCSIFVDTGRGLFSESQLRYLTLRTPETGMYTTIHFHLYTFYLQHHQAPQQHSTTLKGRGKCSFPGLLHLCDPA